MPGFIVSNIQSKCSKTDNYLGNYEYDGSFEVSLIRVNKLTQSEVSDTIVAEFPFALFVNDKYKPILQKE